MQHATESIGGSRSSDMPTVPAKANREEVMTPPDIGQSGTMAEILQAYPNAKIALFIRYHIGGCASCSYQLSDTLAEVCRNYSIADPFGGSARLHPTKRKRGGEDPCLPGTSRRRNRARRGSATSRCAIGRGMAGRPHPGSAACHGGIDLRGARFLA